MREIEPKLTVDVGSGDSATQKAVKVRAWDWGGLWSVAEAIDRAGLPLPNLEVGSAGDTLAHAASQLEEASKIEGDAEEKKLAVLAIERAANLRFQAAIAELIANNFAVIWQWMIRSRPVLDAAIIAGSNLTESEIATLGVASVLRVAREIAKELIASGVWSEAKSFFVDLMAAAIDRNKEPPPKIPPTAES